MHFGPHKYNFITLAENFHAVRCQAGGIQTLTAFHANKTWKMPDFSVVFFLLWEVNRFGTFLARIPAPILRHFYFCWKKGRTKQQTFLTKGKSPTSRGPWFNETNFSNVRPSVRSIENVEKMKNRITRKFFQNFSSTRVDQGLILGLAQSYSLLILT